MGSKRKRHEILIVAGCCLLYAAISGIGANCKGVFYSPVAEDFGVALSQITFAYTLSGIVSAVCMTPCCLLFARLNTRVSLTLLASLYAVSAVLMGSASTVGWYCAFTVLQGVSSGFLLFFVLQHVIGNWFPNKKGTVLGFVLMSSGIMGMIFNPIITSWISAYGWRAAYRIEGVVMLAMVLPASLFMVRKTPGEAGLEDAGVGAGKSSGGAGGKLSFKLVAPLFVLLVLMDVCMSLPQQTPGFAVSVGQSAAFGALMVSASMFGNLIGKIGLGVLNDRIGVRNTTIIGLAAVAVGAVCVTVGNEAVMLCSSFLMGVVLAVVTLQVPLIFRSLCDAAVYERVYPTVCSVNIIIGAASQTLLSFGYNAMGSYTPVLLMSAADMLVCAAMVLVMFKRRR